MMAAAPIIAPILIIGLIGFICAEKNWFTGEQISGLSTFIFWIGLPALIISSISTAELPTQLPWELFLCFYLPALVLIVIHQKALTHCLKIDREKSIALGLSGGYGNLMLVGLPVILGTLGQEGVIYLFLIVSMHSLILITLMVLQIEHERTKERPGETLHTVLRQMASNPAILSLVVGLALNFLEWRLPVILDKTTELLGAGVTACALITVGASLSQFRLKGQLKVPLIIALSKNLLMPILAWLFAHYVFQLPHIQTATITLMAAMPMGVSMHVMATNYRIAQKEISSAFLMSNLLAIVTLSFLIIQFSSL